MNEQAVFQLLSGAGQKALETMFFVTPDGVSRTGERPQGKLVAASLTFKGSPPGRFGVILSEPVGRIIAANFLGADDEGDLSPSQIAEVCGELTNMICGSVLSDLEADADFDLSVPAPIHIAADNPPPDYSTRQDCNESPAVICRFDLTGGSIVLCLAFGEAT